MMTGDATGLERLETPVVVVGGGVSGCACAASLAARGLGVTLMDPALDRLGEPSFGPLVTRGEADDLARSGWLEELPEPVREAWAKAAMVSGDGSTFVVDRRLVGLLTKHALEQAECLRLRQALIVETACTGPGLSGAEQGQGEVRVGTAFGESFVADAVVIAVGLGLGDAAVGRWLPPAGGLRESLAALGAEFAATCAEVGPSFGGEGEFGDLETLPVKHLSEERGSWGEGSPASPYEREELWRKEILIGKTGPGAETGAETGTITVSPDGVATGEVALTGDGVLAAQGHMVASRPGYVVEGLAITNVDGTGRLAVAGAAPPVWITGRAAGSSSYVDSLLAGVRTAGAVAEAIAAARENEAAEEITPSAGRCGEVLGE